MLAVDLSNDALLLLPTRAFFALGAPMRSWDLRNGLLPLGWLLARRPHGPTITGDCAVFVKSRTSRALRRIIQSSEVTTASVVSNGSSFEGIR